jgi:flagellar hook-length control protein FliK
MASPASEDPRSAPSGGEIGALSVSSLTALPIQAVAPQEANTQKDADSHSPNSGSNKPHSESVNSTQTSTSADSQGFARTVTSTVATLNSDSADLAATAKAAGTSLLSGAALREHAAAGPAISESLQAWNGGDNAQTAASQMAALEKNTVSSEVNIALQAETLGNVEMKAHITGDQIGATITVDRHDVHTALVSDLPSLHLGLSEKQMRMDNVTVQQGSLNPGHTPGGAGDTGAQKQQRNSNSQRPPATSWNGADSSAQENVAYGAGMADSSVIFDSKGRLSVRA